MRNRIKGTSQWREVLACTFKENKDGINTLKGTSQYYD